MPSSTATPPDTVSRVPLPTVSSTRGGAITAAEGGSIALLGAQVDNRGTVLAQMGGVGLGAGSDLTLNFDGNKLLDIRVDAGVANALASNGGLLKADGGES